MVVFVTGCGACIGNGDVDGPDREGRWGIYYLDLDTGDTELIISFDDPIGTIRLDPSGQWLAFSKNIDDGEKEHEEICTVSVTGEDLRVVTSNGYWDLYPTWSSDGERIAFLSWRDEGLDIYVIGWDGKGETLLFDSGYHDADIHWACDKIVFTSQSCIYMMNDDGTSPRRMTSLSNAGEWGDANLPFGDYDPQLDPTCTRIVFERLEDDSSPHGNYNIYSIGIDGNNEERLTDTGYSQGFASWSHSGDRLVFMVSAIGDKGVYDIYVMNADGSDCANVTPQCYPDEFLCSCPIFSIDDSRIYFVGEWWE
ncbi:MAG TPA: hypothetical protein PK718_05155 [Candidatus Methanofastidiosa archaeon]|nr:hypothetical protein [Candidatus Methanofastidiosa archaeon]